MRRSARAYEAAMLLGTLPWIFLVPRPDPAAAFRALGRTDDAAYPEDLSTQLTGESQ